MEELVRFCEQPSISAQRTGIAEMADLVAGRFRSLGASVSVRSMDGGNPAMLSTFRGDTPRTLLFHNHYDVQPPEPLDKWTSSPFEPLIKEGALHARGAADNRGALVARLAAIRAFLDVYGQLPVGVRYIVEGEEEIGNPRLQAFIDAHREQIGGTG